LAIVHVSPSLRLDDHYRSWGCIPHHDAACATQPLLSNLRCVSISREARIFSNLGHCGFTGRSNLSRPVRRGLGESSVGPRGSAALAVCPALQGIAFDRPINA
jgi:hypothetical protein